jgi:hypothetical protein
VKFEYSPALGLAVIAALMSAAAVTILAVADDNGDEASTNGVTALGASDDDRPPAPWRAATVARSKVPLPYLEAWDRAGNRTTCALLFPADGGPEMPDAKATSGPTPDDKGWDIFLTGPAGSVEVLGLFDKATQTSRPAVTPSFTRTWADGSVARYAPDVGNVAPGTYDPNTSPFEAVLILPDQSCAYRIYDTLGRAHLESVFDRLRLLAR